MIDERPSQSQPLPGETTPQPETCPPDCDLPENSKENLDARLDHAIEETFPTSDPISVTVTKKAVAEVPREAASTTPSSQSRVNSGEAEKDTAETLLDQVRDALQDVGQTASGLAREAHTEGQRRLRQVRERYPEAARHYQEGRQAVRQRVTSNPWLFLLAAGAFGYVLAWMIHGQPHSRDGRVPDYARTHRSYASHRDDPQEG